MKEIFINYAWFIIYVSVMKGISPIATSFSVLEYAYNYYVFGHVSRGNWFLEN
jgi:hypothetical protein